MTSPIEDANLLQEECEQLWSELKGLKGQVQERHLEPEAVHKDGALGDIYRHKQQALEAHLKVLKESEVTLPPNLSEESQGHLILEKLERSVGEMQETLLFVTEQREQCEREVKHLQTRVVQEEKMEDALQEKLADASAVAGQENESEVLQQLKKDCEKTEMRRKQLVKDMKTFVNEHFPAQGKHSLIETLQLLMNECVESPLASYVECKEAWQPYLEMLLRTGIAVSHKDNDKLIRLTAFQL